MTLSRLDWTDWELVSIPKWEGLPGPKSFRQILTGCYFYENPWGVFCVDWNELTTYTTQSPPVLPQP